MRAMSDALPEPELRDLTRRDRRAFVETMGTAFADDPLFVMLFGPAAREMGEARTSSCRRRAAFVAYLFDMNRLMGGTPRGLFAEGRLVGAALLEPPPRGAAANGLRMLAAALRFAPLLPRLGATRSALLNRYFRGTRAAVPRAPHHYLLMIGVRPGAQGRGWGKRLMQDAISRSDRVSRSAGIALDTENADNVRLYELWGFERRARFEVGGVVVHSMFRPRQAELAFASTRRAGSWLIL
ncbi:MAG: GNAT family N-acetyltransferase [Actinobacteria bacterium]|nr:GNAT family N-acetyltransferase [Actinomycetota bacterium]